MFTGLVQKTGVIARRGALALEIQLVVPWSDLVHGESIAVNGACLTLERIAGNVLIFHTLEETLKRTNLGTLPLGSRVNLERALRVGDALGGHIVSGHVDAAVPVRRWTTRPGGDLELAVTLPEPLRGLVASKGSIAIDGVSLTVVAVRDNEFTVELIPVTRSETALAERPAGTLVNLEADLLARYVARQLAAAQPEPDHITMQTLFDAGFVR